MPVTGTTMFGGGVPVVTEIATGTHVEDIVCLHTVLLVDSALTGKMASIFGALARHSNG